MISEYQSLILPFLHQISDRKEHKFRDLVEVLATEFKVTNEERKELLPSNQPIFEYHVGCVRDKNKNS